MNLFTLIWVWIWIKVKVYNIINNHRKLLDFGKYFIGNIPTKQNRSSNIPQKITLIQAIVPVEHTKSGNYLEGNSQKQKKKQKSVKNSLARGGRGIVLLLFYIWGDSSTRADFLADFHFPDIFFCLNYDIIDTKCR